MSQVILHHLAGRFPTRPSRVTVWRILKRNGLITPEPHKGPRPPSSASKPNCPTSSGRPTPPNGASPIPSRSRSSTSSTTTPASAWPPWQSGPSGSRRGPDLLFSCRAVRTPGSLPQRQRGRLQRQISTWSGGTGVRARPPRHSVRSLHSVSPSDLRQGRTLPPDPQASHAGEAACGFLAEAAVSVRVKSAPTPRTAGG